MSDKQPVQMEFHIARQARDRYQFDQSLFSLTGNVVFANFHAARVFAQKMNARRDLVNFPEQVIRAGQINAMGLIDEILHMMVQEYRKQRNPTAMEQALNYLYDQIGLQEVDAALRQFAGEFPTVAVYNREMDAEAYLQGESTLPDGATIPNRQIILEEMLMLWLANMNPAFSPFLELFDDTSLEKYTVYPQIFPHLKAFFDTQPRFGPENQNLIDMLRAPALAFPHSLEGQLEFIRTNWTAVLGRYLYRLLTSLDLIKEEQKVIFGVGGPGPAEVLEFTTQEFVVEPEQFSPDRDWMPNLVLIAKNAYVWLDQLSKKYNHPITTLNMIPDEELDTLARRGFTGLWLIGLWERSMASKQIKQLRGNPDAVASAYSLFSYEIAADLGGDEAYRGLRDRAWKRGIRLASDMVPNHMGIDSLWVIEHPDWFISLDYSPFPSYTFNGPNLSWDDRVSIFLEDHYYDSTDAAVVFKRRDNWTGSEKYIYHGNDGTSMPWNDTAQLNYLNPEVREAVIQTILHVARKFPIIRFDAAMTLAKKHYQRLWYPEPGTGGAIPTRAEYGLTKEQFDAAFPVEFWREVVDRVAQEVPDTLLLAEAFWMMEGYFVRTLGMHRVYNSAFMNMLRDEKNQEYRLTMKNTLEFEPEILKRYVNFMNNPDERTAVDQFGKGDKYFGIATLMATMPGLPMFGHGQIEGYSEKYGMEFRRAYWDERPDGYLVERHEREIFPLLRRRYLFAEVRDFLLYDFFVPEGHVNEDVFAYSNRAGEERSLVIYHNKFASTRGWIRSSVSFPVKQGDERVYIQKTLAEGLGLQDDENTYTIFRDHVSGLEYIRSNRELHEQGLYAELDAYKYHVFLDFRQVQDDEWRSYGQLAEYLAGGGVPNIEEAMKEIFLQPIHTPFRELVNHGMFGWLLANRFTAEGAAASTLEEALDETEQKALAVLQAIEELVDIAEAPGGKTVAELAADLAAEIRRETAAVLALPAVAKRFPDKSPRFQEAVQFLLAGPAQNASQTTPPGTTIKEAGFGPLTDENPGTWGTLFGWLFTHKLGKLTGTEEYAEQSRTWIDEWLLGKLLVSALTGMDMEENAAWRSVWLVKLLTGNPDWCASQAGQPERAHQNLQTWLQDTELQRFLGVNRFQGILWFNREAFEELLWWLFAQSVIQITAATPPERDTAQVVADILDCYTVIEKLQAAEAQSDYQVEKLLEAARGEPVTEKPVAPEPKAGEKPA